MGITALITAGQMVFIKLTGFAVVTLANFSLRKESEALYFPKK